MTKENIEMLEQLASNSQYQEQGEYFLKTCGVKMTVTKCVPQKSPQWLKDGKHGIHWNIQLVKILSEKVEPVLKNKTEKEREDFLRYNTVEITPHFYDVKNAIDFDFWGSIADKEKDLHSFRGSIKPTAYDVLAGLYSMYNDTFEEWCASYGYDEDSREAYATYKRCLELDAKLKKVFTSEELEALQYIN